MSRMMISTSQKCMMPVLEWYSRNPCHSPSYLLPRIILRAQSTATATATDRLGLLKNKNIRINSVSSFLLSSKLVGFHSSSSSSSSSLFSTATSRATTTEGSSSSQTTTATVSRPKKRDAITITPRAAQRIQTLVVSHRQEQQSSSPSIIGIRLGVRRRGCNGLSYTLNYATESDTKIPGMERVLLPSSNPNNNNTNTNMPITILIEPMALFNIVGTTMDYIETDLSTEFTFENPNSKGSCGCGESFNV